MAGKRTHSKHRSGNAVVLIDYTNVFGVVSERSENDQPDAVVIDLIVGLNRYLNDHLHLRPIRTLAFANLPPGNMRGHRASGAWLAQGIEPRLTYARSTDEASAIELAMEAMDISAMTGPDTAFVVLSGNQWFVPLVQRLQRKGHFVIMATLERPSQSGHLPSDCHDAYLYADFLLSGTGGNIKSSDDSKDLFDSVSEDQKPKEVSALEDEVAKRTLGIIDSYFGQYEEIYLTPLLRKLSEIFEESDDEPKMLINSLEDAGAVWLEKRRGFPHNYTVLMLNTDHPDVMELKEAHEEESEESYDDYYDDDYQEED